MEYTFHTQYSFYTFKVNRETIHVFLLNTPSLGCFKNDDIS